MTLASLVIVAIFMTVMGFFALMELNSHRTTFRDYKSIIISTGLLGTFLGILIGLWAFDTMQIKESVPELLNGLKTAFITSVVGMGLAIALGAYEKMVSSVSVEGEEEAYRLMVQQQQAMQAELAAMREAMATQHKQMAGLIDKRLRAVERTIAEGASQAVIEALQQTMNDFNNHLINSFGENFKALERSVGDMVRWQQQYRDSIAAFEQTLEKTVSSTQIATETLKDEFRTMAVQNREAFEILARALEENSNRSIEAVNKSAKEVYRNFDELIKVQQHLDTMTQNYARMAEITERVQTQILKGS